MDNEIEAGIKFAKGGSGKDKIEGYKIEATYELKESIDRLQASVIQMRKGLGGEIENLTKSLEKQSKNQDKLQSWIVILTVVLAIVAIVNVGLEIFG